MFILAATLEESSEGWVGVLSSNMTQAFQHWLAAHEQPTNLQPMFSQPGLLPIAEYLQ